MVCVGLFARVPVPRGLYLCAVLYVRGSYGCVSLGEGLCARLRVLGCVGVVSVRTCGVARVPSSAPRRGTAGVGGPCVWGSGR